jgi:DNA-binding IclR family transcriptional regulator
VHTLESQCFLTRDTLNKKYGLGLKLWELGCAAVQGLDFKEKARPFMMELVQKSQESVYLSVLDGPEVVYIDRIESDQPIRAGRNIGGRILANLSASGKAILAFQEKNIFQEIIKELNKRGAFRDESERLEFENEFIKIRKNGLSTNIGMYNKEVGGTAAPIFNHNNEAIAAISITGLISHFKNDNLIRLCNLVKDTAKKISITIGANHLN